MNGERERTMKSGVYLAGISHGQPIWEAGIVKRCWTYERDSDDKLISVMRGGDEFCNPTLCISSRLIGSFCFVTARRLRASTCDKCLAEFGVSRKQALAAAITPKISPLA